VRAQFHLDNRRLYSSTQAAGVVWFISFCVPDCLAPQHHESKEEPNCERILGILEDRSGNHAKSIALLARYDIASVLCFVAELAGLLIAASCALCAMRPAVLDQKVFGRIFGGKEGRQLLRAAQLLSFIVSRICNGFNSFCQHPENRRYFQLSFQWNCLAGC
jgi:hypothetical protein